jgi:uncharacterized protein (UPF0248 family)
MIPIHELLARIRWDPQFGRGQWEIAYVDHTRAELIRVPLKEVRTRPGEHFMFERVDEGGATQGIPFHRIREVWRDGTLFWSRHLIHDITRPPGKCRI